jgi:hypothetical protein
VSKHPAPKGRGFLLSGVGREARPVSPVRDVRRAAGRLMRSIGRGLLRYDETPDTIWHRGLYVAQYRKSSK